METARKDPLIFVNVKGPSYVLLFIVRKYYFFHVVYVYESRDDKSFEINLLFIKYMKGYF